MISCCWRQIPSEQLRTHFYAKEVDEREFFEVGLPLIVERLSIRAIIHEEGFSPNFDIVVTRRYKYRIAYTQFDGV